MRPDCLRQPTRSDGDRWHIDLSAGCACQCVQNCVGGAKGLNRSDDANPRKRQFAGLRRERPKRADVQDGHTPTAGVHEAAASEYAQRARDRLSGGSDELADLLL